MMDARLQRRVQRYGWDRAAEYYEWAWARQLEPAQRRLLDFAALRPGERVLEIAAGTGLVTFRAAEAVGPRGSVLATDISDKMVEHIREVARQRAITNVSAERMEAEDLRLEDESFDVVLCALGLMFVTEPVDAMRQMLRVLRPGGRAAFAVWGARSSCGWAELFPIVERRVSSEVCPLFFQLGTGDALAISLEQAGFADIQIERLPTTLEYENADEAVGGAFLGGAVAMAYSRFDEPTRQSAQAEYLASIAAYKRGSGFAIPAEFVIAIAVRR